jgi:hypothetical protein
MIQFQTPISAVDALLNNYVKASEKRPRPRVERRPSELNAAVKASALANAKPAEFYRKPLITGKTS